MLPYIQLVNIFMQNKQINISPSQMATYRATAQLRRQSEKEQIELRYQRANVVARQAAQLLKERFGVTEVILFGSASNPKHFWQHSDIDLAVWGLSESCYYRALACLLDLDYDFDVDLIMAEEACPTMMATIINTGVRL